MLKRISSLVLCLALLVSGWPASAMAEEAQPATPAEAAEEPCAHAAAAESTWEEISYWPIGDEQHSVTTYAHEHVECPDCGAVLRDETHIVGEAYAEAHAYNDEGVCPLCAHTAPAGEIMPLSLDITEEETTRAMSLSVDDIVVGQAFSFSWSEVPSAHHYEVAVTRIDKNDVEHKLLGDASTNNRQDVGTSRSFTVSAADVAADTKRMRVYVGAAPDTSFPTAWDGMIKEASATIDARYDASSEMDVRVSISGDTATVEWAEVAGADHYLYKVLDATNGNAAIYQETQTQALSFELPGLVTGHEYKIWVASYDAGGALISQHTSQSKLLLVCHHEQTEDVESAELFGNLTETTHTRYARFDVVCKACGEVISTDQIKIVGQEEHAFTGNVCDVCGYDKTDKNAVLALTVGEAISGKPLAVSWNAINGADHYQYDVKDLTTDASVFGGMQTTADTSLTVDGAKVAAGHEYKIWAAAFGADGVMLTQATQTVTAEQVTVEITLNIGPAIGGQTLIVTWNEVEGVDHYQYNIRNLSTDTPIWGETGESTQIPSLMLHGILVDDNVEYKIWVGAFDASGSMMAQTTQTVKTTVAQSNPMNLSYSGTPLAGVDLQMSWSKMNDADHYEYSLRDVTTNAPIYSRVETNAAYFTIPGAKLEADHSYRFWVGAIGADGAEPDGSHQGSVTFAVVQCPHGSATPKNETATRTSISDTQHHVVTTYDLYCTYCDTVIEEGKTEEYDENHNLDENGNCTLCGYKPALKVIVNVDAQSAWTGDMLGADAVVTGGSGSYTYYWEVYHNGHKVDYTTDARDRYTFTANEEGQWKFVVLVTDEEDDETFWAESAVIEVKKCDHTPVSEELSSRIDRNWDDDANTHFVVKTVHEYCKCGKVDEIKEKSEPVAHDYTIKGRIQKDHEDGKGHALYDKCVCGVVKYTGYGKYEHCEICYPPETSSSGNRPNNNNNNNQQGHTHVFAVNELANQQFVNRCLLCGYQEPVKVTDNSTLSINPHIKAMKDFTEQATKYGSKLNKDIDDLLDAGTSGVSKALETTISEYYANNNGILIDGIFNFIANPIGNGIDNTTELLGIEEDEIIRSIIIETVCGGETSSNSENALYSIVGGAKSATDVLGEVTSNVEGGLYSELSGMYDAYFSAIEEIMLERGIITATGDIVEGKESLFAYYHDYDIAKNPSKLSAISDEYRYIQTQKALSNRTDVGFVTNVDGQNVYGPATQTDVIFDSETSKAITQMDEFSDLVEDYNSSVNSGKKGETAGIMLDVIGCGLKIYSYKQQHDLEKTALDDLINEEKKYCRSIEVLNALCSSTNGNKRVNDICIEFREDLLSEFKGLANDPASQNFLWKTVEAIGETGINITIGVAGKNKLIGNIKGTQELSRLGAEILTLGGITKAENVTELREQFQTLAWTKMKIEDQLAERTFNSAEADDGLFYLTELYYTATKREYDLYEQYIDMQYSPILPSELNQAEYYRAKAAVASAQSNLLKKQNQIRNSFNQCIQNAGGDWEFDIKNDYEEFAEEYLYKANYIEMTSSDLSKPGDSMISPPDLK